MINTCLFSCMIIYVEAQHRGYKSHQNSERITRHPCISRKEFWSCMRVSLGVLMPDFSCCKQISAAMETIPMTVEMIFQNCLHDLKLTFTLQAKQPYAVQCKNNVVWKAEQQQRPVNILLRWSPKRQIHTVYIHITTAGVCSTKLFDPIMTAFRNNFLHYRMPSILYQRRFWNRNQFQATCGWQRALTVGHRWSHFQPQGNQSWISRIHNNLRTFPNKLILHNPLNFQDT